MAHASFLLLPTSVSQVGFNHGEPITEEFFRKHIAGRHNPDITAELFPEWDMKRREAFTDDKEERFRRWAMLSTFDILS